MSDNKTDVESTRTSPVPKEWVQFEEKAEQILTAAAPQPPTLESSTAPYSGAVLDTQSVSVDVERVKQHAQMVTANQNVTMRNVNLEEEPANGSLAVVLHGDTRIHRGFGESYVPKLRD